MATPAAQVWTVGSLLTWTTDFFARKNIDEPRLSAELLLAHVLKCSRMALYTQYERVPPEPEIAAFRDLVKQRANHVPVAYLIGKAWFFSLELAVTRDVLIPRPDTETLVEFVIQHARQRADWAGENAPRILDLCTGSGAIAIALAKHLPSAAVVATDLSAKALEVAQQNAQAHGVGGPAPARVTFFQGDLYGAIEHMPAPALFHVIASNPPYIPSADVDRLPPGIREHEPRLALDGGSDGLEFHRRIVAGARNHLHPGGLLIMEMQVNQGPALIELLEGTRWLEKVRVIKDAAKLPRCVVGFRRSDT
ncbi:MAG TPA: peptide chain release factor N(5)-glutamine methyltransferase [Phycisphaerae bacterium]|nr:peptide chain release factor N(5)-glutamine methyltransferase [Phycisphaerae bacterium]